jgi:hypothetical protein
LLTITATLAITVASTTATTVAETTTYVSAKALYRFKVPFRAIVYTIASTSAITDTPPVTTP